MSTSTHNEIVSPAEALRDVKGLAKAGRVEVSKHARQRMGERGLDDEDVFAALMGASACEAEPLDRWKVFGHDLDGEELKVVVVIELGVVVVTVF